MRARDLVAIQLLAAILVITAAWWAFALWPLPEDAPTWLTRTRWVCFNAAPQGLPDGGGWLLLVAQPLSMLGTLLVIWGDGVRAGLRAITRTAVGRGATLVVAALTVLGMGATAVRVARAASAPTVALPPGAPPATYPRLDRPAPPLVLTDQTGGTFDLAAVRGRPAIVTFAFAHCTAVCPLVVQDALRARELAADLDPALAIVTLDPWRDPPARLPAIAQSWRVDGDAVVLSGTVAAVEAALDDWQVARARDSLTGDVAHPPLVYLVDREGRIAYAATGNAVTIAELLRRL
jgi:cytochrome oxidase Cu insertion factor (SCO1/SenC/PrrC family)